MVLNNKSYVLFFITIITAFILNSCGRNECRRFINDGVCASDSLSLELVDTIVRLPIGDRITPNPHSSLMKTSGDVDIYALMDEKKVYIFRMDSLSVVNEIDVSECGDLRNYSGFSFITPDSIFVYDYAGKKLSLFGTEVGKIVKSHIIEKVYNNLSPEALNASPILITGESAILTGQGIYTANHFDYNDPLSVKVNLEDGSCKYGVRYPEEYSKAYFGGVYMHTPYHCADDEGRIVYSFPASNYVFRYDTNLDLVDSIYMGSRYTDYIESAPSSSLEWLKSEDDRIRYYISQHSYSSILYDPFRKVYYRIAEHPLSNWDGEWFIKPFSIVVSDTDGNIITETPLVDEYESLNKGNMHVGREGLMIQKRTEDENTIDFVIYKLKYQMKNEIFK